MEPYLEDIGEKYSTKVWRRYSLQAIGWEQTSYTKYWTWMSLVSKNIYCEKAFVQHWNNLIIKMYIFFHLVWVDQAAKSIVCEIPCKAIMIRFIGGACFEKSRARTTSDGVLPAPNSELQSSSLEKTNPGQN